MTTKIRITKTITNQIKRKSDSSNNKKNTANKNDSITEIQVSNWYNSTKIEEYDFMGWGSLPEIPLTSEDSDTCDMGETEWLDDSFYQQMQKISNLEYAKLKLSNFAVKLNVFNPIIASFDSGTTCSCFSYQLFTKVSDKVDLMRKTLWENTARGTTLGLIGIVHLTMNNEEHSF